MRAKAAFVLAFQLFHFRVTFRVLLRFLCFLALSLRRCIQKLVLVPFRWMISWRCVRLRVRRPARGAEDRSLVPSPTLVLPTCLGARRVRVWRSAVTIRRRTHLRRAVPSHLSW